MQANESILSQQQAFGSFADEVLDCMEELQQMYIQVAIHVAMDITRHYIEATLLVVIPKNCPKMAYFYQIALILLR